MTSRLLPRIEQPLAKGWSHMFRIPKNVNHTIVFEVSPGDVEDFLSEYGIDVLSTARLLHYMAVAARELLKRYIPQDHTSVGYYFEIYHVKPTTIGERAQVTAKLLNVDGYKAEFKIEVKVKDEVVAKARHKRRIISVQKMIRRVYGV